MKGEMNRRFIEHLVYYITSSEGLFIAPLPSQQFHILQQWGNKEGGAIG